MSGSKSLGIDNLRTIDKAAEHEEEKQAEACTCRPVTSLLERLSTWARLAQIL